MPASDIYTIGINDVFKIYCHFNLDIHTINIAILLAYVKNSGGVAAVVGWCCSCCRVQYLIYLYICKIKMCFGNRNNTFHFICLHWLFSVRGQFYSQTDINSIHWSISLYIASHFIISVFNYNSTYCMFSNILQAQVTVICCWDSSKLNLSSFHAV